MNIIIYTLLLLAALYFYSWYQERAFQKQFKKYLTAKEGSNILFYNNRKQSKYFIESDVIPRISNSIEPIFLDGKGIKCCEEERKFLERILFDLKHYSKFPHLVKIRNCRIEDLSINNDLFNCINQGKSISTIIKRINHFFGI